MSNDRSVQANVRGRVAVLNETIIDQAAEIKAVQERLARIERRIGLSISIDAGGWSKWFRRQSIAGLKAKNFNISSPTNFGTSDAGSRQPLRGGAGHRAASQRRTGNTDFRAFTRATQRRPE